MSEEQKSAEEVGSFYEKEITAFWEMVHQRHMHVGYWDAHTPDDNLYEGSKRFTEMLVDWCSAKEGDRFLDLGCGFGIPGMMLAEKKGVQVTGLTASEYQAAEATTMAFDKGLPHKVEFHTADAAKMDYPPETFDGAWFFESIFHMGHETILKKLHPALKPGAEVIIADFNRLDSMTPEDWEFLKATFFVNTLVSKEEYPGLLKACGYDLIEMRDVTAETIITWEKYSRSPEDYKNAILDLGGQGFMDMLKGLWPHVEGVMKRSTGYVIIKARKI